MDEKEIEIQLSNNIGETQKAELEKQKIFDFMNNIIMKYSNGYSGIEFEDELNTEADKRKKYEKQITCFKNNIRELNEMIEQNNKRIKFLNEVLEEEKEEKEDNKLLFNLEVDNVINEIATLRYGRSKDLAEDFFVFKKEENIKMMHDTVRDLIEFLVSTWKFYNEKLVRIKSDKCNYESPEDDATFEEQDMVELCKMLKNKKYCEYILEYMLQHTLSLGMFRMFLLLPSSDKNYFLDVIREKRLAYLCSNTRILLLDPQNLNNEENISQFFEEHEEKNGIKSACVKIYGMDALGGIFNYVDFTFSEMLKTEGDKNLFLCLPNVADIEEGLQGQSFLELCKRRDGPTGDFVKDLKKAVKDLTKTHIRIPKATINRNFYFYKPILASFFKVIDELNFNNKNLNIKKNMNAQSWGLFPLAKSIRYAVKDLKTHIDKVVFINPPNGISKFLCCQTVSDVKNELGNIGWDDAEIKSIDIQRSGKGLGTIIHDKSSYNDLCQFFVNNPRFRGTRITTQDAVVNDTNTTLQVPVTDMYYTSDKSSINDKRREILGKYKTKQKELVADITRYGLQKRKSFCCCDCFDL